ncbi:MAG: hypothetical protein IPG45_25875 [Deltaproteobacteria bacterium]|nr:hypothetical protein [Deltaproteobacteria bacterium]
MATSAEIRNRLFENVPDLQRFEAELTTLQREIEVVGERKSADVSDAELAAAGIWDPRSWRAQVWSMRPFKDPRATSKVSWDQSKIYLHAAPPSGAQEIIADLLHEFGHLLQGFKPAHQGARTFDAAWSELERVHPDLAASFVDLREAVRTAPIDLARELGAWENGAVWIAQQFPDRADELTRIVREREVACIRRSLVSIREAQHRQVAANPPPHAAD